MDNNLLFWAQGLDNKNDIVATVKESKFFILSDQSEIGKAKDNFNHIVSHKENKFTGVNVIIYYKRLEFVIETTPNELDSGNRRSPIEIYGQIPVKGRLDDWLENVDKSIKTFVSQIERSIDEEKIKEIKRGLTFIENKKKWEKYFGDFLIKILIALVSPFILGWIIQWKIPLMTQLPISQTIIVQVSTLIALNNIIMVILFQLPVLLQMKLYNKEMIR